MAAVDGERLNEGKPELVRQIKTARCCRSVCVCADEYAPQQLKEEAEREASPRIHARPDTFHYKRISWKGLGIRNFYHNPLCLILFKGKHFFKS